MVLEDVEDPTMSRQADGDKVVSLTPNAIYSPETFFCVWYSFLSEAKQTPGPSAAKAKVNWENSFTSSSLEIMLLRSYIICTVL
jgi:hypothetical protein